MTEKGFTSTSFGLAPERTARRNLMEAAVMRVFAQYGYNEVNLPIYEYYDVLKTLTYNFKDENNISFVDRASGRMMVLRPDFTPQVCRMVAGYKGEFPLPLRVCYRGRVFRNVNISQGVKAEIYQVGCELYGTKEIYGDLELILCLHSIMRRVGVDNYRVVFGDAAYMFRLLSLLGENAEAYKRILFDKKIHEINDFADNSDYPEALKILLKKLPTAFGGVSELKELMALSAFDADLRARVEHLEFFFKKVTELGFEEGRIVFDPSEARGLDYYTGISFEVLSIATGKSLGGGGRYDALMKKFNMDYTACGMGLYLSEIEDLIDFGLPSAKADWIVVGDTNMAKAEELRSEGYSVIHLFDGDDPAPFLPLVRDNKIYGDK